MVSEAGGCPYHHVGATRLGTPTVGATPVETPIHATVHDGVLSTDEFLTDKLKIPSVYPGRNMSGTQHWLSPGSPEELAHALAVRALAFAEAPRQVLRTGGPARASALVHSASAELLRHMAEHLSATYPELYRLDEDGEGIQNLVNQDHFRFDSGEHPLQQCGLLGQEDLVLLRQTRDGRYVVIGGFLASPTHWSLRHFERADMDRVHANVTHYTEGLKSTVDRVLDSAKWDSRQIIHRNSGPFIEAVPALSQPDYAEREVDQPPLEALQHLAVRVGSLATLEQLLAHGPAAVEQAATAGRALRTLATLRRTLGGDERIRALIRDLGQHLFLRTERETIRRLRDHDKVIVFGLRPDVRTLETVRAERGDELLAAMDTNDYLRDHEWAALIRGYLSLPHATPSSAPLGVFDVTEVAALPA